MQPCSGAWPTRGTLARGVGARRWGGREGGSASRYGGICGRSAQKLIHPPPSLRKRGEQGKGSSVSNGRGDGRRGREPADRGGRGTNSRASILRATKLGTLCVSHVLRISSIRGWCRYCGKPRFIDWSSSCRREGARVERQPASVACRRKGPHRGGQREEMRAGGTHAVDVEVEVGAPRARACPEPEHLPLAQVEEDTDGGVAPGEQGGGHARQSARARSRGGARTPREAPKLTCACAGCTRRGPRRRPRRPRGSS